MGQGPDHLLELLIAAEREVISGRVLYESSSWCGELRVRVFDGFAITRHTFALGDYTIEIHAHEGGRPFRPEDFQTRSAHYSTRDSHRLVFKTKQDCEGALNYAPPRSSHGLFTLPNSSNRFHVVQYVQGPWENALLAPQDVSPRPAPLQGSLVLSP